MELALSQLIPVCSVPVLLLVQEHSVNLLLHIAEKANLCLLCFSWMLTISIEDKISDVSSAGVWWFQFDAAGGRQPTGNTRFCSSLKKNLLLFPRSPLDCICS